MTLRIKTLAALVASASLALMACSPASTTTEDKSAVTLPTVSNYLTRDIQEDVFYFVMPDRFHNADSSNDNGDPVRKISQGGLDKTSKWAFHGGDMQGVEAKLDYIQGMGVTAIWMTPLLRNRAIQNDGFGHHGYWVIDFTEIDPHFGTNEDLKSLINAAHERGIKVFFDIITNHTADVIKYKECHKPDGTYLNEEQNGCQYKTREQVATGDSYTLFVMDGESDVKTPAWLNDPQYYNNQGDSFWEGESAVYGDFAGLDDIDTRQAFVVEGMTDIFKNLISEFKPDGFRIDTVKHVDLSFWQQFGPAIVSHAQDIGIPKFHIFGEVYDGNPAGLSKYTTAGMLPSVLDFGFHFNIKDALYFGQDINRIGHLFDNDDYYRDHDSGPDILLNFLGNHDAGRVGHFIQKGMPNEDAATHLQRSILSHAYMYFSRGVPVVYYGDEQGFSGDGGDVDARENMDPSLVDSYNDNTLLGTSKTTADDNFDTSHPIYQALAELSNVRQSHKALMRGIHQNRLVDDANRLNAFSRVDEVEQVEYLVLSNMGTEPKTLTLEVDASDYEVLYQYATSSEIEVIEGKLTTELAPLSIKLLKASEKAKMAEIASVQLKETYVENDRIFIPAEILFKGDTKLNLARVAFFAVDENGEESLISEDTTFPYRAVVMPERLANVKTIKVIASNMMGKSVEGSLAL
ncbi:alpha-amylase family glycosyl hydrolase [Glaciecola sp. KUL10]|uniref:alpha-amylase family glycosyl hydrolase n=1 Tax=Glaciecola sp. (strain KUL10) TaxID=2161813 RepID=UPI000D78ADC0|nr:alpha-amylase family glycosyl hydrolase [Glaciecola sp. KUL10]GBL05018.1 alpha amylase [Glaciecola sp. KUL10]